MKRLLLFCLTSTVSAWTNGATDDAGALPAGHLRRRGASLALDKRGDEPRSLVRRVLGELKPGMIGGAYPHMQHNVLGSDYFNWLPQDLHPDAKAPITQAKPALERLEKHRDEAWYDAGLGHHSKSMASKASVRYNDLTEQQLDVAHNAAARALRAHKGNFSPVTGFHVDPSLHGYKEFRKLPDDLHSVARLLVAGGASRMRQKEWERVDGKWSMERSARMGSDGQRGWVAQSKREQEHIAKVTAHNALALHNHLHGKEVGSMSPQEIAQQAEFSTKKAKAVPSPAKQPELPRIEYPDSDQESVHEPKRGAGQKLAIMGKQAPLALPGPRGWKSADEDRGEEKRSKKLLKWFKPKDKD